MRRALGLTVLAMTLALPGVAGAQESEATAAGRAGPTTTTGPAADPGPGTGGGNEAGSEGIENVTTVGNETAYRNALAALSADITAGPHTILLTDDITLASATAPAYSGTRDLVIDGDGHKLDGGLNSRVLEVSGPNTVGFTFEDITVQNARDQGAGLRQGGAVLAIGSVTVRNAVFQGNRAVSTDDTASGGAIKLLNGGTGQVDLTIEDSVFTGNRALAASGLASGGAVAAQPGTATVSATTFEGNVADNPAGNASGGAAVLTATTIVVEDSTVAVNKVTATNGATAGGFSAFSSSTTIRRSVIRDNSAAGDDNAGGGGVSLASLTGPPPTALIADTVILDNEVQTDTNIADGGGIKVNGPSTEIRRSMLAGNAARSGGLGSWGGGVAFNSAASPLRTLEVTDSTIAQNQATGATTATNGGGIRAFVSSAATVLTMQNSTVAANAATGSGGQGGGLWTKGTSLDQVTLASNTANSGANYFSQSGGGGFTRSAFGDPLGSGDNCSNPPLSQGHNADDDGTCLVSNLTDLANEPDLGLSRVRNNADLVAVIEAGGNGTVRPTMFPLNGSPLIDAIPADSCSIAPELDLDQRGVDRPFGAGCDIGAIEAVFPAHALSDVTPFYEATVRWVTSTVNTPQILSGYPDGTFGQSLNITRGQAARLYYNGAGAPDVSGLPFHGFSDGTAFFDDAITYAKANGIFDGFPDNTFRPDNPINRGNFIRSLYGFAGSQDVTGLPDHPFTDVTLFYENAVKWAKARGLADGFPDNTFRQNDNINRGNASRTFSNTAQTPTAWDDPMTAPPNMLFRPNIGG